MTSPTQKALALYRGCGYLTEVTEHWNPFSKTRHDLFNLADLVAVGAGNRGVIFVQASSGSHHAERVKKCLASPNLKTILQSGSRVHVVTWGPKRRITSFSLDVICQVELQEIDLPDDDLGGNANELIR